MNGSLAASLLFGNTKSTFGIPQVQTLEKTATLFPTFGKITLHFSKPWKKTASRNAVASKVWKKDLPLRRFVVKSRLHLELSKIL